jgi:hypothetical protein
MNNVTHMHCFIGVVKASDKADQYYGEETYELAEQLAYVEYQAARDRWVLAGGDLKNADAPRMGIYRLY